MTEGAACEAGGDAAPPLAIPICPANVRANKHTLREPHI